MSEPAPRPVSNSEQETVPPALAAVGPNADPHETINHAPPREEMATELPPVPGYELLGVLGKGGMGVVYKARHLRLNRVIALKMVLGGAHAGEAELQRFLAEAEALASLQHPNVVQVYDSGQHQGLPYCALEFVSGGSLADRLDEGPLPAKEAAQVLERIAQGVQAAHDKGIVHRDLKPGNVLLAPASGREDATTRPEAGANWVPKVTDFGLAKRVEGGSGLTRTGAIMGTPSYMAPEQADGESKKVGPAADVWALGAMLYECLTGRPPFRAATPFDTILQVLTDEPVAVRQLQPSCPRDLETICHKCLTKDVGKRYASSQALADDLRRYLNGEPITARPVGTLERGWRWSRRNPVVAGLLGTLAAVLLLGIAVATGLALYASAETARAVKEAAIAQINFEQARTAEGQARTNEQKTKEALATADEERKKAQAEEDLKARQLMTGQLMRVAAVYERDPAQAKALLFDVNACPIPLRDTAWRFYERCCSRWEDSLLTGHTDPVSSVAFSPDGLTLASGSHDKTVRLWDVKTGQSRGTFAGHTDFVYAVAFSPDGSTLASGSGGRDAQGNFKGAEVRLWDIKTGRHRTLLTRDTVASVAFSPDGLTLASGSRDWTVRLWDVNTGQLRTTLTVDSSLILSVAFSPNGLTLASGSTDNTVRLWDVKTGQTIAILPGHTGDVKSVAFSPDGLTLASGSVGTEAQSERSGEVRLWDIKTGRHRATLQGHTDAVNSVAFSPDGLTLASSSQDMTVRLWDVNTGQPWVTLPGHMGDVTSVAFGPDGRTLASSSGGINIQRGRYGEVRLWNVRKGQAKANLQGHAGAVTSVAFSPNGLTLASASGGVNVQLKPFGEVRLWNVKTGQHRATLLGHTHYVLSVAISPDGLTLASGSQDKTVRLWNAKTGRHGTTLTEHTGSVRSVAFSPDGQTLASGSGDWDVKQQRHFGEVRLWDVKTGQHRTTLPGHTGAITSVVFSPDGLSLASASQDKMVRLWDVKMGQAFGTLGGHTDWVTMVAFSPDGQRVFGWDNSMNVRGWTVKDGKPTDTVKPIHLPAAMVVNSPDGSLRAEARFNVILLLDLKDFDRERDGAERLALEPVNRAWWHQHQGQQAEQDQDWFAAAFHLGQLEKDKPNDATVISRHSLALLRLGIVEAERGDMDAAKRHRDSTVKTNRNVWPALARAEFDRLLTEIDRKLTTARMDPLPPP